MDIQKFLVALCLGVPINPNPSKGRGSVHMAGSNFYIRLTGKGQSVMALKGRGVSTVSALYNEICSPPEPVKNNAIMGIIEGYVPVIASSSMYHGFEVVKINEDGTTVVTLDGVDSCIAKAQSIRDHTSRNEFVENQCKVVDKCGTTMPEFAEAYTKLLAEERTLASDVMPRPRGKGSRRVPTSVPTVMSEADDACDDDEDFIAEMADALEKTVDEKVTESTVIPHFGKTFGEIVDTAYERLKNDGVSRENIVSALEPLMVTALKSSDEVMSLPFSDMSVIPPTTKESGFGVLDVLMMLGLVRKCCGQMVKFSELAEFATNLYTAITENDLDGDMSVEDIANHGLDVAPASSISSEVNVCNIVVVGLSKFDPLPVINKSVVQHLQKMSSGGAPPTRPAPTPVPRKKKRVSTPTPVTAPNTGVAFPAAHLQDMKAKLDSIDLTKVATKEDIARVETKLDAILSSVGKLWDTISGSD